MDKHEQESKQETKSYDELSTVVQYYCYGTHCQGTYQRDTAIRPERTHGELQGGYGRRREKDQPANQT